MAGRFPGKSNGGITDPGGRTSIAALLAESSLRGAFANDMAAPPSRPRRG